MADAHTIDLKKRTIALVGDKDLCRYFYLQFFSAMDINYLFVTAVDRAFDTADSFFEKCPEITYMPLKESLIRERDILLILCCGYAERPPYDHLLFNRGFEWGKDYIDASFVVQYHRHRYHTVLEEKNIWIFGAGNNGRYFYERYKDTYAICGFISNYEEEKEYQGLPVIRPLDILQQEDPYIVICSDAAVVMSRQLCALGLIGGKDYGFSRTLPKKLLIAMGSCQVIKTAEALCRNEDFENRYDAELYLESAYEFYRDADNRRLKGYGSFCDVVFYSIPNAGVAELRDYRPLIETYYKGATKLYLPFYCFRGQLQQVTGNVNPYALRELKAYSGRHFWFRGDREINHMLENGHTMEEILEKVLDVDYWSDKQILNGFRQEMKKIEVLDRLSSFPIKPFIEAVYQRILVFIDGTHFSYQLCQYLADEIAKCLDIRPVHTINTQNEGENSKTGVMPVYPCVRRALGMTRGEDYQFYDPQKDEIDYLDVEGYLRRYIEYVTDVLDIQRRAGTTMAY